MQDLVLFQCGNHFTSVKDRNTSSTCTCRTYSIDSFPNVCSLTISKLNLKKDHVTNQKLSQTFTLPCSRLMWATKTSLELKRLLQSPHVYPEPGGFLRFAEQLLTVFFKGEGEGFFSPLSWPLAFPPSLILLLLLLGLLLLVLLELVGLVLRGRLMPKFGGPSMVFRVPWMAWKVSTHADWIITKIYKALVCETHYLLVVLLFQRILIPTCHMPLLCHSWHQLASKPL